MFHLNWDIEWFCHSWIEYVEFAFTMSHRWQTWLLCRIWTVSLLYLCTFEVVISHMRCLCWICICKSYIWPEKAIADKKVWLQVMHSHLCVCVCACHRKIMICRSLNNFEREKEIINLYIYMQCCQTTYVSFGSKKLPTFYCCWILKLTYSSATDI